jgi:predicted component of type VI protein secretion system
MALEGEIHWSEGLFLQPHHLQIMQRNVIEKFTRQGRMFWSYPYGVIETKISDDQLENMRVSFDRLRVIMPSGLEVNVPDNANLPSLDIKQAFASTSGALTISIGVPVWYAYLMLRQLLAELAALRPDRDQYEVVGYDHDNLAVAFNELSTRIRGLLKGVVRARYLKIPFTIDHEQKFFTATLTDEALSLPNEYFLAIKTKQDPSELAKLVLDRDKFKMMPQSLANQRIFGVQLAQELYPPVELPAQVGLHYFRVMRGESVRLWERIQQEKTIAVRWPGVETSDFEITLYMTVPDTEAQ